MPPRIASTLLVLALAGFAGAVGARTSDRNQPMDAASNQNSCTLGDAGKCVLTGAVHITQGSLEIHAAKAVIYRGGGDISRAVLDGSPATVKQVLDDGTVMTAHAANVDYDLKREIVTFTGNVEVTNSTGNLRGERVVYNLRTGGIDGGGGDDGQVHMRILPRKASGGAATQDGGDAPAADTDADGDAG